MKKLFFSTMAIAIFAATSFLCAGGPKDGEDVLRTAKGVYDTQRNTVSNFDFYTTNYGVFGLDVERGTAGGYWPRGSSNIYLFGSGFWFGAQKKYQGNFNKLVEVSYNPNSGKSWFVPGRIEDGDTAIPDLKDKYRVYFSTDFNTATGVPLVESDGPNWPLWISDTTGRYQYSTYRHTYEHDATRRNSSYYPYGPMFVSGEDIVTTFKDTDLNQYEGGAAVRKQKGYPMRLQGESRIYSWGEGDMHDIVMQVILLKNTSTDTLFACWFGGVYDVDIAYAPNGAAGAANDRVRYLHEDTTLNLVVGWTGTDRGEAGKEFGYIGLSMLETPAVDDAGFIRNDKLVYEPSEQIGLATFRNWSIVDDIQEDVGRYDYISSQVRDGDVGPGDMRVMMATGPFNMRPGDVARIVISTTFAMPAMGGEADGTYADLAGFEVTAKKTGDASLSKANSLIGKIEKTKEVYYEQLISSVPEASQPKLNNISLYPNPASGRLNVGYDVTSPGNIHITLINQFGSEVAELFAGVKESGSYNEQYQLDNRIPNGVYYLKIRSGNYTSINKIIIIR